MKKTLSILSFSSISLLIALFVGSFTSCEGPAGPAGADANAHCLDCHSAEKWEAITASYEEHAHATGSSWARGSSSSCQMCHSAQGFTAHLNGVDVDVTNPMAVDCEACHGDHGSLEEPVGPALATTSAPISLADGETLLNVGDNSNMCAVCHQSRRGYAYYEAIDSVEINDVNTPVPDGSVAINSSHAGPHHSNQSNFLLGKGSYLAIESTHSSQGCTDCHMGEPSDGMGGHTWVPTEESCTTCHSDGVPEGIDNFDTDLTAIANALVTAGALSLEDGEYHPHVGIVSADEFEAFWAYMYLYEDQSHGVHNPPLAKALINDAKSKLGI